MKPTPRTIDWKAVYETTLMEVGACHTHCGGYCCKNFYASDFHILSAKEVVLPLLESEYEYLVSVGGLKGISDRAQCEEFSPIEGHSLKVYFMKCSCEGLCSPHSRRPLVCRLYPYLPLVDDDGTIVGFDYAALVDLSYASEAMHPCHLVTNQKSLVQAQIRSALQPLIQGSAEMVFLLKASELIARSLRNGIGETFDPKDGDGRKAFLKKYEYKVFTRAPWRTDQFKREMATIYRRAFGL